jgi:hypothetical protein
LSQDPAALTGAIERLRSAIAHATTTDDAEVHAALAAPQFADGEVAPGLNGLVDHASADLAQPVPLGVLEARFGPGHRAPAGPRPGRPRSVQFNDTLPPEGSVGGTVLAELGDTGQVVRVIVRRDAF